MIITKLLILCNNWFANNFLDAIDDLKRITTNRQVNSGKSTYVLIDLDSKTASSLDVIPKISLQKDLIKLPDINTYGNIADSINILNTIYLIDRLPYVFNFGGFFRSKISKFQFPYDASSLTLDGQIVDINILRQFLPKKISGTNLKIELSEAFITINSSIDSINKLQSIIDQYDLIANEAESNNSLPYTLPFNVT